MSSQFIDIQMIYEDFPDLIELQLTVQYRGWSAVTSAYTSPAEFIDQAQRLRMWVTAPQGSQYLCAGDSPRGWWKLKFAPVDHAGHIGCGVALATEDAGPRPESCWKTSLEVLSESGLVESFANRCIAMCRDHSLTARLTGIL